MRLRRPSIVIAVAALSSVFVLAAACGSSNSDEAASVSSSPDGFAETVANGAGGADIAIGAAPAADEAALAAEGNAVSDSATAKRDAGVSSPTPSIRPAGRRASIIRVGTIDVRVQAIDVAVAKINALATQNGGYVESSQESFDADYPSATITIRVPSEKFDSLRSGVSKVGDVQSAEISAQDVTGQLVDLESRLRNLRAEEAALNALLARTTTVEEVLAVQPQLFDVREQIEQLDGQRAYLESQAAMSTLTVVAHSGDEVIEEPTDPSWWDRVTDRVGSAWSSVSEDAAFFLVVALPILLLICLALWLASRVLRRFAPRSTASTTGPPQIQQGPAEAPSSPGQDSIR